MDLLLANWNRTLGVRLIGDVNGDDGVDARDLRMLLREWGSDGSAADVNGDWIVDDVERETLLSFFGGESPIADLSPEVRRLGKVC